MFPVYEEKKKNLHIHLRTSPHLHNSIEFIYITEGTLELGMGQELYHMEEGDLAVIFPDVIHHYQVFSPGENKAVYLWAKPVLIGKFADIIQNSCPEDPVIKKNQQWMKSLQEGEQISDEAYGKLSTLFWASFMNLPHIPISVMVSDKENL